MIEIWRPAPNRPRNQGRPGGRRQNAGQGHEAGKGSEAGNGQERPPRQRTGKGKRADRGDGRGDKRGKGPRRKDGREGGKPSGPRTYTAAPPKKERKADPDSPFAALAGLLDGQDTSPKDGDS